MSHEIEIVAKLVESSSAVSAQEELTADCADKRELDLHSSAPSAKSAVQALPAPRVPISIRPGTLDDLAAIDALQKKHGRALGFFPRAQMEGYLKNQWVLIAEENVECGMLNVEKACADELPRQSTVNHQQSILGYIASRDRYQKRDELGAIFQLCVADGIRRKFVGATLVKAVFDRAAYGCKLFCLWCAQDLDANRFWEAMGFVPLAFRAGSAKKSRVHIFWQKRIREGDTTTPWWFPSQTGGGSIREDRIVLPIPPGVRWDDEMPRILPENRHEGTKALRHEGKEEKRGRSAPGLPSVPSCLRASVPSSKPTVQASGGLRLDAPPVPSTVEGIAPTVAKEKPKRQPKAKIDPKLISAARELRDRWLEQVNDGRYLPESAGKYDVARVLTVEHSGLIPGTGIDPIAKLPAPSGGVNFRLRTESFKSPITPIAIPTKAGNVRVTLTTPRGRGEQNGIRRHMTRRPIEALESRRLLAFAPIQIGAQSYDSGYEVAVDAQGNTIAAGLFQHTVDFDPSGAVKNLTAVGETDIYIAKYSPNGALIWVGQIGGIDSDMDIEDLPIDPFRSAAFVNRVGIQPDFLGEYINSVAVDASGNIFLGGTFYHTCDFDPKAGKFELSATEKYGLYDAFLVKLNASGSLVWAKKWGGEFNDVVNGVAIDPAGNPVVTGYFTRRADFDPGPGTNFIDVLGRDDIFVMKFAGSNGNVTWVETFGGEATKQGDRDSGNGIAIDASGNIFVTGSFADEEIDFDPGPGTSFLSARKRTDVFILELNSAGQHVLSKSFGGDGIEGGVKIAVFQGQIYIASYFQGEIDVDPSSKETLVTSFGDDERTDLLVSKFNANGSLQWAKRMGSDGYETIGGFGVANDGSVYTSGGFYGTAEFDPGKGTFYLTSIEGDDDFDDPNDGDRDFSYDIYVSHLNKSGNFLGAQRIGSSGDDFGTGLVVTGNTVTLTGQFRGTVAFNTPGNNNKRRSNGVQDSFLIELTSDLVLIR